MAGIGRYKKGKAFKLKSGNAPAFKMMGNPEVGESPITKTDESGKWVPPKSGGVLNEEKKKETKSPAEQNSDDDKKEKGSGWKKALSIGVGALTSGLDAVYGTGKIMPRSSDRLKKKEETTEDTTEEE